jgi:hypothetical protein
VGLEQARLESNRAQVKIRVDPRQRYEIEKVLIEARGDSLSLAASPREIFPKLCRCLFAERKTAEREGRLDFQVRLEWQALEPGRATPAPAAPASAIAPRAKLVARIEPGAQYRVGRIAFRGNHKLRETTLRRALALDEGDWLNPRALRAGIDRLSRFELIEPVPETDVQARRAAGRTVDLTIVLRERTHGRWSLSGPLGPLSWFGPLRFGVDSRLPPWGRGVVDLSTWLATFGVLSYTDPVARILSGETKVIWQPFAALRRPLLPGQETTSGFLLSPSLGWKQHLIYSGMLRARAGAGHVLQPSGDVPPLAVVFGRREHGERLGPEQRSTIGQPGIFLCKPNKARLDSLRVAVRLLLDLAVGGA